MLVWVLIIAGILSRLVPHTPNFTPVCAIAIFSGAYLKRKYSFIVPLILMIISDIFIGMHDVVLFTWGSFALVAGLGMSLKKNRGLTAILGISALSSIVFFLITNFGVWVMGWYPRSLKGLVDCYIMALPFLRDFTISTLFYSLLLFGTYELIARSVRQTRLAKVLL